MTQKKEHAFSILIKETENAMKENIANGTLWALPAIIENYNKNSPTNIEIICLGCGKPMKVKRSNNKYHNNKCKARAFRMK